MQNMNRIQDIIYSSIDEINELLPKSRKLEKKSDTILYGNGGKLDSVGLVNLIVSIEGNIEDEFDIALTIADEKAMSLANSPFHTVDTLTKYINQLMEENE